MPLTDAVDFINKFVRDQGIPHFYIGAIASSLHGRPRSTEDADLVLLVEPSSVPEMLDRMERAGISLGDRRAIVQRKLESGAPAKIAWDDMYSFDLRLVSYTIDRESLRRSFVEKDLSGRSFVVAPPEEIVVYKLARFVRRDKGDIKGILQAQNNLDWRRIEELSKTLSEEIGNPEILENLETIKGWVK